MSFEGNLDKILQRHAELSEKLSSGIRGGDFVRASKDCSELEPIVEKISEYKKAITDLDGAKEIANDSDIDAETKELAEDEIRELGATLIRLEREVKIALLPKDEADSKGCFAT